MRRDAVTTQSQNIAKMSGKGKRADQAIRASESGGSFSFYLSNEAVRGALSLPEAMCAKGFTMLDSKDPKKQTWIQRQLPKKR